MHGFGPDRDDSHTTSNNVYNRYMDKVKDQHTNGFDVRDPFAARLMQAQNAKDARDMVVSARQEVIKSTKDQLKQKKADIREFTKYSDQMSQRQRDKLEDKIFSPLDVTGVEDNFKSNQKNIANIAKKYNPYGGR